MFFLLKISSSVLKIYPVLLFSFLEDVSEVAVKDYITGIFDIFQ